MESMYLVWDTNDSKGGTLDGDGNVRKPGRTVLIRLNKAVACSTALDSYRDENLSQLVVELLPDGTRKIVCFVGVMDGKLFDSYGRVYEWIGKEADRAMAAALVVLANNVDRARC